MTIRNERLEELRSQYDGIRVPEEMERRLNKVITEHKAARPRRAAVRWILRFAYCLAAAAASLTIAANVSASAAGALSQIPVIGAFARIVTFREYTHTTSATEADIKTPHVTGLDDRKLEKSLNDRFDRYAGELIARYESDIAAIEASGGGHEAVESSYKVLTNDGRQLTIAVYTDIAMGDSQELRTYYTIDKTSGKLLALKDLFRSGTDYVTPISAEILSQMKTQMKADPGKMYFINDSNGPDYFKKIAGDQQFYIDGGGRLVVSFDESEVATAAMGPVSFVIPTDRISAILAQDTLVR